jgi:hypothetical protein
VAAVCSFDVSNTVVEVVGRNFTTILNKNNLLPFCKFAENLRGNPQETRLKDGTDPFAR